MTTEKVAEIIEKVKPLAAEYYRLTGKPLGTTGEIGEFEVARLLGLQLAEARSPGYDAKDASGRAYQIKTRSLDMESRKKSQKTGTIKGEGWDAALLAIMSREFEIEEIWEADRSTVEQELNRSGSKARNERRQISISKFKTIGKRRYIRPGYKEQPRKQGNILWED